MLDCDSKPSRGVAHAVNFLKTVHGQVRVRLDSQSHASMSYEGEKVFSASPQRVLMLGLCDQDAP